MLLGLVLQPDVEEDDGEREDYHQDQSGVCSRFVIRQRFELQSRWLIETQSRRQMILYHVALDAPW